MVASNKIAEVFNEMYSKKITDALDKAKVTKLDFDPIVEIKEAYSRTTGNNWRQGSTSHDTVANVGDHPKYKIGSFHHADDANFVDKAHELIPHLIVEIERLRDKDMRVIIPDHVSGIEAQDPLRSMIFYLTVLPGYQYGWGHNHDDTELRMISATGAVKVAKFAKRSDLLSFVDAVGSLDLLDKASNGDVDSASKLLDIFKLAVLTSGCSNWAYNKQGQLTAYKNDELIDKGFASNMHTAEIIVSTFNRLPRAINQLERIINHSTKTITSETK